MSILVYDIGTSKIKAGIYTDDGKKMSEAVKDNKIIFPRNGWAEQDPNFWLESINEMASLLIKKSEKIEAIGITGQMIGLVPVDKNFNPLGNAIIWLDSRANAEAEEIMQNIPLMDFLEITGGIPSGKDVISKILWLRNNMGEVFEKTFYFLDVKDFLIARLTGRAVTDISTASVRGLVDIRKRDYSDDILNFLKIDRDRLPEITDASNVVGEWKEKYGKIEVVNGSGDAFVTPFGAGAVIDGKVHYYLGTSGWASTHSDSYLLNEERGIGSVPSAIPGKWLFISESESAGSCLDWFMENTGLKNNYKMVDSLSSKSPPGSGRLIFLPWLYGERSPILDVYVRGGFINLSLSHKLEDLLRSIFEGVSFNTRWMLEGIGESGIKFKEINAVGGGAKSNVWMQILSDVTGMNVNVMEDPQNATMKGIALISLISLNKIRNFVEAEKYVRIKNKFSPDENNRGIYDELFDKFKGLYESLRGIFESLNSTGGE